MGADTAADCLRALIDAWDQQECASALDATEAAGVDELRSLMARATAAGVAVLMHQHGAAQDVSRTVAGLRATIDDMDATIHERDAAISARDAIIAELQVKVDSVDALAEQLGRQNAEAARAREAHEKQMARLIERFDAEAERHAEAEDRLVGQVERLTAERDDLAGRLEATEAERDGLADEVRRLQAGTVGEVVEEE